MNDPAAGEKPRTKLLAVLENARANHPARFDDDFDRGRYSGYLRGIEDSLDAIGEDASEAALAAAAEQLRESNAAMERLQAENELQRKCFNKLQIGVRNACTILGGEIFLAEFDKPRLYEPALKVHDYLRKLVDAVDTMMGESNEQ